MRLAIPCALVLLAAASCARSAPQGAAAAPQVTATTAADPGPRAAPGLVRWHECVEAARAAAVTSGKPVLVFQLLGRLDDELC